MLNYNLTLAYSTDQQFDNKILTSQPELPNRNIPNQYDSEMLHKPTANVDQPKIANEDHTSNDKFSTIPDFPEHMYMIPNIRKENTKPEEVCGKRNIIQKSISLVIGGNSFERGEWPFIAALLHNDKFICGGTLSI